ncbi:transposable element Tcb1 transposase [Trichonephila clavipes]|nr:transposable element Tcb1 transposase [Trichonephila clavipes]
MSAYESNSRHLREVLIFCFNVKKSVAKAHRMLSNTDGEAAISERTCREWFQRFKNGDLDVEGQHGIWWDQLGVAPRVTTLNDDWYLAVTAKRNRRSTASDLSRQLSSAIGTTVSTQTVYRRLGHIGLYAGWLVWGGIILDSRTDLHVQSVTMTDHIYRDFILEQHVSLFRGAMGAELLFVDDNARPHPANIVDECLQSEDISHMVWPAYSPDLNPIEHMWDMLGRRIAARQPSHPSTEISEGIA